MHFALAKCIPVPGSLDSPLARSAAAQRGVRQDVMPLRRGNSEILTHKDTLTRDIKLTLGKALTRAKAYALTGEYSTHADNRISAHAGKQTISLTREKNGIIRMRLTEGKRISS